MPEVARFGWSPAEVEAVRLPGALTFPNATLTGVSSVGVPISKRAAAGPVPTGFWSRPTTRPVLRVSVLPAASASVLAPVVRLALSSCSAPPAPIV